MLNEFASANHFPQPLNLSQPEEAVALASFRLQVTDSIEVSTEDLKSRGLDRSVSIAAFNRFPRHSWPQGVRVRLEVGLTSRRSFSISKWRWCRTGTIILERHANGSYLLSLTLWLY